VIGVTGAAGFIGRNLIERLEEETEESIIAVDLLNPFMDPFEFLEFIVSHGDEISIIFHNGACSDTTVTDPNYVMKYNAEYSIVLLRLCIQHNIRLIYASSASVYGDGPFTEETLHKPKNLYALSKSIFDSYSSAFVPQSSQIVGLRYFNVFGKYEENKGEMASVVYKFFNQIKNGTIKLFENSSDYLRDFIHVDDVIEVNLFFYHNPIYQGIYNVGTSEERSFEDIANIFKINYGTDIEYVKMPPKLVGKYQAYTKSDNTKIRTIFPHTYKTLEQGVEKYLSYLENQ